jgi:hypothetical protein
LRGEIRFSIGCPAAGLPTEPATVTAARFVTRQLFDPAMLCQGAPVDPVLDLMVPEVAAQAAAHPGLVVRLGDCAGLDFGALRVGVAVGSVSPQLPNGRPGTTVSLTVSAVVPDADADGAPWAIQREVRVGTAAEQPDRIVTVSWEGAQVGAGIGTPLLPEPGSLPAWDEELFPGPAEPDPDSAAAVVQALARTLAEKAVAVGQTTVSRASGEEPTRFAGSGVLVPATGEVQLTYQERGVTEVRVLGHQRQFSHRPADDGSEPWSLYATGETPGLFEGSYTNNPFAVLDWLRHLSAAAPAECPEGLEARGCHAVEVPTAATLTPGTPGYREGMVHARRGNAAMVMLVGVSDARLAGVALSRRETDPDGTEHRVSSTWTFGPWDAEVPVVARPDSWRDVDA